VARRRLGLARPLGMASACRLGMAPSYRLGLAPSRRVGLAPSHRLGLAPSRRLGMARLGLAAADLRLRWSTLGLGRSWLGVAARMGLAPLVTAPFTLSTTWKTRISPGVPRRLNLQI